MSHGFLGYSSTFMLDFVVTALVLIVPVLLVSLYLVKVRRNYLAHRNLQLVLAGVLLVAVVAFEVSERDARAGRHPPQPSDVARKVEASDHLPRVRHRCEVEG